MISAAAFLEPARALGYDFYTGVPCSFLTPLINRVISDPALRYVGATSEGEAVAIAAGGWLAGRKTVVMCQNSGLGNTVNPLTSLNWPFRIPTLLIVTWRGQPGLKDEPQHELMGQVTAQLLDVMRVPHAPFPKEEAGVAEALARAEHSMAETGLPFALIMEKGAVADEALNQPAPPPPPGGNLIDRSSGGERPARAQALQRLLAEAPDDAAIIATTGKTGRELFTLADRHQQLYQVGSMGCAGAMGLGVALNVKRPVIVIDGDGAALMKLGALATIGAYGPDNLLHLILDNGVHDSTGGQATVSPGVSFAGAAQACGYRTSYLCDSLVGLAAALNDGLAGPKPCLIHLRTAPGSLSPLGRPTVAPSEVARRFRDFLAA
ncbi:MAG: phosphonopyruvate decarboxylase [Proteobacteria bacterium]|nr:phosphonopyruvate decarboxylase [Pseudomonadota bacterium]MDA1357756.1 phosphonopyruvate decarboxylase [Pseudomonadota bacterium]